MHEAKIERNSDIFVYGRNANAKSEQAICWYSLCSYLLVTHGKTRSIINKPGYFDLLCLNRLIFVSFATFVMQARFLIESNGAENLKKYQPTMSMGRGGWQKKGTDNQMKWQVHAK